MGCQGNIGCFARIIGCAKNMRGTKNDVWNDQRRNQQIEY
jgi:hypothetical protein